MSAAALLARLRALGVALATDGDHLTIDAPAGVLTPALLAELRGRKWTLLALLAAAEPAVAWRVAAMVASLPPAGPVPFLVARATPRHAGGCCSCGEPVLACPRGVAARCLPCRHAAHLVTEEYMSAQGGE